MLLPVGLLLDIKIKGSESMWSWAFLFSYNALKSLSVLRFKDFIPAIKSKLEK